MADINYYQIHGVNKVDKLVKENPTAFRVLNRIAFETDGSDGAELTQAYIAEKLDVSVRTVRRAIAYLKNNGYVLVIPHKKGAVTFLNPSIAWKGSEQERKVSIEHFAFVKGE